MNETERLIMEGINRSSSEMKLMYNEELENPWLMECCKKGKPVAVEGKKLSEVSARMLELLDE